MATCLWCKKEIENPRKGQRFCSGGKCKDAYWNAEKMSDMRVPECFRGDVQNLATGLQIPLVEAITKVFENGFKYQEQGRKAKLTQEEQSVTLTDNQVWGGNPKEPPCTNPK